MGGRQEYRPCRPRQWPCLGNKGPQSGEAHETRDMETGHWVGRGGDGDTPTPGQQMFTECAGWSRSSPQTLLKAASCLLRFSGTARVTQRHDQTVRTSGESSHGPLQTYVALGSGVTDGSFALWVLAPGLPAKSRTSKSSRPQCSWPKRAAGLQFPVGGSWEG